MDVTSLYSKNRQLGAFHAMQNDDFVAAATLISTAILEICNFDQPSHTKVLDFGCGAGGLVNSLLSLGYDAYGCDVKADWLESPPGDTGRLKTIPLTPYRLPFEDNTLDVVVSTSVLEHAQNKEEYFQEFYRVLKVGGYSMHLFPGKWYMPYEPHIYVPLANFLWPKCPKWWLGLWALLGVRNEFQQDKTWKEVVELNYQYSLHGLSYWSNRKYRQLSMRVFGNCSFPMEFYITNAPGGFGRLFRRLPFKKISGSLSGELRMNFIVQRKTTSRAAVTEPDDKS